jgi:hypothetical protein
MTILKADEVIKLAQKSELSKMEVKDLQDTWAVFQVELSYIGEILNRAGFSFPVEGEQSD